MALWVIQAHIYSNSGVLKIFICLATKHLTISMYHLVFIKIKKLKLEILIDSGDELYNVASNVAY
jgi:hypothetical protein